MARQALYVVLMFTSHLQAVNGWLFLGSECLPGPNYISGEFLEYSASFASGFIVHHIGILEVPKYISVSGFELPRDLFNFIHDGLFALGRVVLFITIRLILSLIIFIVFAARLHAIPFSEDPTINVPPVDIQ